MSLSTLKGMNDSNDALSVDPSMIQGAGIQWPGGSALAQNFSLPLSIMYYIAMNPSTPKVYNKLIQTCKYFYERNPILVAATLTENTICSNDGCCGHRECCVKMDIKKIKSKIWLTRHLGIDQSIVPNFIALLRPKVYRCDIAHLTIIRGSIDFDDFNFFAFAQNVDIFIFKTKIVRKSGSPALLESILEELSNVQMFECCFENNDSMVSASTVKNISKLKNLGNLKELTLFDIPEDFKLDDLFSFIKDRNDIKFWLVFASFSDHYKIQLDQLTDSVIDSQLSNCYIQYDGQDQEKNEILLKRYYK